MRAGFAKGQQTTEAHITTHHGIKPDNVIKVGNPEGDHAPATSSDQPRYPRRFSSFRTVKRTRDKLWRVVALGLG